MLGFLRKPLGDLCISRPAARLNWGIPLPFDRGYVTYVWFDALINYLTAAGHLSDEARFNRLWPSAMHLIGKDILTTHAVYWPTMLHALGLPPPHAIRAHGWWNFEGTKMSKSLGNVVRPLDLTAELWQRLGWTPPERLGEGLEWGGLAPRAQVVVSPPLFPRDVS